MVTATATSTDYWLLKINCSFLRGCNLEFQAIKFLAMTSISLNALINLLGFALGVALYGLLLTMVLQNPSRPQLEHITENFTRRRPKIDGLLLATAVLGLIWNIGELITHIAEEWELGHPPFELTATAFTALGFLPAVVVHSAWQERDRENPQSSSVWITTSAYLFSATAGLLHFVSLFRWGATPSEKALIGLTFVYAVLIGVLFWAKRKQSNERKVVWAAALGVFAISALHLSGHNEGDAHFSLVELIGHQSSLPLVLAILYQDYRFAFADLFLKRAMSLLLLAVFALGLYVFLAEPLLKMRDENGLLTSVAVGGLLGLWILTALVYPGLRRFVVWFVDKVILNRADYNTLRNEIAQMISTHEHAEDALDAVSRKLAPALTAESVSWKKADEKENLSVSSSQELVLELDRTVENAAHVFIPTAEPPYYELVIGNLRGGRRLFSDDVAMLEAVAVMTARRLDTLRVTHERCEQDLREKEIGKLATEAQLKALRAQINPHFLFNALTTIGYLIKTSPEHALETLMRLTELLRGVLKTTNEFVTLGEELKLIASYLEIEKARFEERLRVTIDVPKELHSYRLPSLLIQPIVENAIKHGIAPQRSGGEVIISAKLEKDFLIIKIEDTGAGVSEIELARNRSRGVGLNNVEQRLRSHFDELSSLTIESSSGKGAIVQMRFPALGARMSTSANERASASKSAY